MQPSEEYVPSPPPTSITQNLTKTLQGIQNYTCTGAGSAATAIGAIATLYDGTALARTNLASFHSITRLAVKTTPPKTGTCYTLPAPFNLLPKLGNHLFTAEGVPAFLLTNVKKTLFAKKLEFTPAPAGASAGPAGTGAVDWLKLDQTANAAYAGQSNLGLVYRVETAGGKAITCTKAGVITVQYAAEYWFYV
jgi:hypothetical protein